MFAIGVFVGIIGFLVKSATGIIFEQKYKLVEHFIEEGGFVWVCASVKSGHNRCQGKKYCMPIATLCILAMGVETNKHIKIHENVSNPAETRQLEIKVGARVCGPTWRTSRAGGGHA